METFAFEGLRAVSGVCVHSSASEEKGTEAFWGLTFVA